MKVRSHQEKIGRLQALRARLDPQQDFGLWFWAGMTAGTHAVNAALHHAGVTLDEDRFPTQPGVYLVPQPDGSLRPAFGPLGDVLHVGRPKVEAPVPADIAAMMAAMEEIEHYRDPCLREGLEPTPAIAGVCDAALRRCLALLAVRLEGARDGH
ncbi:hypothetical protein [Cupriavidus consociatus]|uniref:hypothetical protein n=1 Tax=Cupriavidus consociatus TaxID=2821357 RepID=UPI001AE77A69|nr:MULTISPECIES: hypothetical protein [unclassified Cupriavidus]MBP0619624.1 hypothetical protein [Cupriavidus sp. LEh25]MDK2656274.1 hypothetical protein [Cupriavidus sp. LEh21]